MVNGLHVYIFLNGGHSKRFTILIIIIIINEIYIALNMVL